MKKRNATQGKLVICPTPLGNLADMPPRAAEALRTADVVCCEDTRVTGKLLAALGVEGKRLERLDEATIRMPSNKESVAGGVCIGNDYATVGGYVVQRAAEGETIVYCTDAGMPGISDPGQYLVDCAYQLGVEVEIIPGPSALTVAYVASGFACPQFYFGGFFPRKAGQRKTVLEMLRKLDAVAVFYESPHRLAACLQAIAEALPTRQVCVCRELTKLHEEVVRGAVLELAQQFAAREAGGGIKGEIVVVVDAPGADEAEGVASNALAAATEDAQQFLAEGVLSKKEIVAHLQKTHGISRNAAYELVHQA